MQLGIHRLRTSCAADYRHVAVTLFEHDVSFQAISRGFRYMNNSFDALQGVVGISADGALRELGILPRFDVVQVCTRENRLYLESFPPRLAGPHPGRPARPALTPRSTNIPDRRAIPTPCSSSATSGTSPTSPPCSGSAANPCPASCKNIPKREVIVAGADPPPPHASSRRHRHPGVSCKVVELPGYIPDVRPLFRTRTPSSSAPSAAARECGSNCWKRSQRVSRWSRRTLAPRDWPETTVSSAFWPTTRWPSRIV